jgi:hypothetical protein
MLTASSTVSGMQMRRPLLALVNGGNCTVKDDCTVNVKDSMDKLKSAALNGCSKKFWPETINDF